MSRVRWEAVTASPRHAALDCVSSAVSAHGGAIEDVHLFSDLSACLTISLPATQVSAVIAAWDDALVHLDAASRASAATTDGDVSGTLSIVFATGRGALRHEVPSVPG